MVPVTIIQFFVTAINSELLIYSTHQASLSSFSLDFSFSSSIGFITSNRLQMTWHLAQISPTVGWWSIWTVRSKNSLLGEIENCCLHFWLMKSTGQPFSSPPNEISASWCWNWPVTNKVRQRLGWICLVWCNLYCLSSPNQQVLLHWATVLN